MALLAVVTVGAAFAQDGKSLYVRLGGIQKIAAWVDMEVDTAVKDKVLLKNERFAAACKAFPTPTIKFLLTNWISSKIGGPQTASGPDIAGIHKWFMLTMDQQMEMEKVQSMVGMKMGYDKGVVDEFNMWFRTAIEKAEPFQPVMEPLADKESLYGRLGGIVPLSLVVDTFVNKLATDKTVMANSNVVKALTSGHATAAGIKYLVTEQLGAASGGPWKYSGRSMAESHKGLMVTEKEWNASAKILADVLNQYKVPKKEQGEIFAAIGAAKGDIVNH